MMWAFSVPFQKPVKFSSLIFPDFFKLLLPVFELLNKEKLMSTSELGMYRKIFPRKDDIFLRSANASLMNTML